MRQQLSWFKHRTFNPCVSGSSPGWCTKSSHQYIQCEQQFLYNYFHFLNGLRNNYLHLQLSWQSSGLLIRWSRVQIPQGAPPRIAQRKSGGFMLRFGTRLVRGPGFESQYGDHLLYGSKSTIYKIAMTLLLHRKGLNIMGQPESCPAWRIGSAGTEDKKIFSTSIDIYA